MADLRTRVALLGNGTPLTEVGRAGTSTAIVVDGNPYLLDEVTSACDEPFVYGRGLTVI